MDPGMVFSINSERVATPILLSMDASSVLEMPIWRLTKGLYEGTGKRDPFGDTSPNNEWLFRAMKGGEF